LYLSCVDFVQGKSLILLPAGSINAIQALQWAQLKVFFADDTEQFTRSEDMAERAAIMRAMLETYFFRDSPAVLPLPAHLMDGMTPLFC